MLGEHWVCEWGPFLPTPVGVSLSVWITLACCVVSSILYRLNSTLPPKSPSPLPSWSSAMQSLQCSSHCPCLEFHSLLWAFHRQCLPSSYLDTSATTCALCPCLPKSLCLAGAWWLFSLLLFCLILHIEARALFPKYKVFHIHHLLKATWLICSVLAVCGKLC